MHRKSIPGQGSLFDWVRPEPVPRFDDFLVRGQSFAPRFKRALKVTLEDCGRSREEIADRMGSYLGAPVSLNMLNAYTSAVREDHQISVPRFSALLHATGDQRLINFVAEPHGWVVINRDFLPLIELASLQQHKAKLRTHEAALKRQARAGGRL